MHHRLLTALLTIALFFSVACSSQTQLPALQNISSSVLVRALPGVQIWQQGISSYVFGTNDTYEWSSQNIETQPAIQHALRDAGFTLIRTFFPDKASDAEIEQRVATIEKSDVRYANMFLPKHSSYFASYFTITGLHGAHVLGGVLVFCYMMLPASFRIYRHNPEHLANRVEVAGLFWHFVDLVWIFVFPLFYLL